MRDNKELHRFELLIDDTVAFVTYKRDDGVVTFLHEEVPEELMHRGVGSALAKGALDLVRAEGSKIDPKCPFMAHYVRSHPEYQDMLAAPLPAPLD